MPAEKVYDLGKGLALYKAELKDLREQDKNARYMSNEMFDRLSSTIKRDERLEQLPFCKVGKRKLEIISGHHRVRAARQAGVHEIFVLADETDLTPSQVIAKQLAHNSIQGTDDEQILRQLWESIEDVDARLEAFIDPADLEIDVQPTPLGDVRLDFDYSTVLINFLPYEKELFHRALEQIGENLDKNADGMYMAELKLLEEFKEAVNRIQNEYEVRAVGTILSTMSEIVLRHLGEELPEEERVHLRDVLGQTYIPTEVAEVLQRAIAKADREGIVSRENRWQLLEYMAADFLNTPQETTV